MFLMIAGVRSTEQSGIIGVKIPFDPNIIITVIKFNNKPFGGRKVKNVL